MHWKILPAFLLLVLFYATAKGQACITLGQEPESAFPACGVDVYSQDTVPYCGGNTVPVPGCENDGITYQDINPFWYKFTCYKAGTLGFTITPIDQGDDYDWELFDITNHNPDDVYTDASLVVAANWSGNVGNTGASAAGNSLINCGGPAYPTFSSMPMLKLGHNYVLLLSHFTTFKPGQKGYDLSFSGGTAVITDFLQPALVSATTNCSGEIITITSNKKLQCKSLALNGSDFKISPLVAKVISASGINCNNSFDMDSFTITLDKPLPPGNYSAVIQKSMVDKNTLLDNCDIDIPENSSIQFTVYPLVPTPMDSIAPVQCAPDTLQLVFRKRMRCNSIAANGSDFVLTGAPGVSVTGAFGDNCSDNLSGIIKVKLNKPIQIAGNMKLTLKTGNDGNAILDECAQETPAGSFVNFITVDTVSADFNYDLHLGCVIDTLFYSHDARNNVNSWNWMFDNNGTSTARDSFFNFNDYGAKRITLNVSNGVCTDTASANIVLDNELISRFIISPSSQLCPEDAAQYIDSSKGKIVSWYWTFGDGTTSTLQTPAPKNYAFPPTRNGTLYPASLTVKNNIGCYDTAQTFLRVVYSCYIAVPSAFTPNGDGLNDYLFPVDAYKADNLEFRIYNRLGQLVFETKDWTKKWDGSINGNGQPAGTYIWMLRYTDHDSGKQVSLKGTTVLIR